MLPEEDPRIVLVLAGNLRQFQDWCRERDLHPRDKSVIYVSDIQKIRGFNNRGMPVEVVTTGSWGEHWSAAEMLHWAHHLQHKANTKLQMQSMR